MNTLLRYSLTVYINNIIFIGLYSNLQNFRFHVKCSVFVASIYAICKTKTVIYLTRWGGGGGGGGGRILKNHLSCTV